MNIFILDYNIEKCAQYHCDKHVVKMILESAQLLSSAVRMSGIDAGYKLTHKNHPCAIWTRESLSNFIWLHNLFTALHSEWKYRYNHSESKKHKSFDIVYSLPYPNIEDKGLTPFALAMPDKYKDKDAVTAYRNYYKGEKQHIFSWKNRDKPYWV